MTMDIDQDSTLTKEDLNTIKSWIATNPDSLPPEIRDVICLMLDLCINAQGILNSNKKLVTLLRQYMGFVPTKERNGKNKEVPEPEWSKNVENKLAKKVQESRERLREYKNTRPLKTKRVRDGNQTPEPVFHSPCVQTNQKAEDRRVKPEDRPVGMVSPSSSFQERSRYDLSLCLTTINYRVETIQCPVTGISKTAKVEDGPPRYRVTWEAMTQIVLLVAGMGIPMVRLASSLQTVASYFSPTRIYRLCLYVAMALFAIYLEIFRQLASCEILSGDDTNSKVLAMTQELSAVNTGETLSDTEKEAIKKSLEASLAETDPQQVDFILEADALLGSQRAKKNGEGFKKQVFTTVVIGERRSLGPEGTLVFYHTERKSFGDLLGKILEWRKNTGFKEDKKKPLVIQSDLSSQNIPTPSPIEIPLLFVGCAAHARRPFWRYRDDVDPSVSYYCYTLILLFDKIFDSDRDTREGGKFKEILEARNEVQLPLWSEIKTICQTMQGEFAPKTDMRKAADYVVNNFEKLTLYLSNPRIRPDNNLAERLLRYEKTMLDNSKFRVSKRGRLAYDILRSILATCSTAKVEPMRYLVHVMRNQVDARKNPAQFTPYAYGTSLKK